MALFSRSDKYLIVVRCPWCGQRTTKFAGHLKDAATDCEECNTRYYVSSTICYVLKGNEGMVDKNLDKPIKSD